MTSPTRVQFFLKMIAKSASDNIIRTEQGHSDKFGSNNTFQTQGVQTSNMNASSAIKRKHSHGAESWSYISAPQPLSLILIHHQIGSSSLSSFEYGKSEALIETKPVLLFQAGQEIVEKIYLDPSNVKSSRLKGIIKEAIIGFKYMSRESFPAEERRLQVKFASPSESGQCATALSPYFSIKAVAVTVTQNTYSLGNENTYTSKTDGQGLPQNSGVESCSQSQLVINSQDLNHCGETSNSQTPRLGIQQMIRPKIMEIQSSSLNNLHPLQLTNEIERLLIMPDQAFQDTLNCVLADPMFSNLLVKADRVLRK